MINFTIPGEPVAKGRPSATTVNGLARLYTPKKTVNYESLVALAAQQAMGDRNLFDGPVSLGINAVFQITKSWSRKRRTANYHNPEFVTMWPDFDNTLKAVCDGINGVVWIDDSQIAIIDRSYKVYGEYPGVFVVVRALE